jgi:hypothetical protein
MEQVQHGVDRLIDRLGPVRKAREEMSSLRSRLEELEASLSELERADHVSSVGVSTAARIETEGEIVK